MVSLLVNVEPQLLCAPEVMKVMNVGEDAVERILNDLLKFESARQHGE